MPEECPVERLLSMVSGKWKIRIMKELSESESRRFNELLSSIPGVSPKVLANQLREMIDDKLVVRRSFDEVPPHVEYALTKSGIGVSMVMMLLRKEAEDLGVPAEVCKTCGTYRYYDQLDDRYGEIQNP